MAVYTQGSQTGAILGQSPSYVPGASSSSGLLSGVNSGLTQQGLSSGVLSGIVQQQAGNAGAQPFTGAEIDAMYASGMTPVQVGAAIDARHASIKAGVSTYQQPPAGTEDPGGMQNPMAIAPWSPTPYSIDKNFYTTGLQGGGGGGGGGGGSSGGAAPGTDAAGNGVLNGLGNAANGVNGAGTPGFTPQTPVPGQDVNYQSPNGGTYFPQQGTPGGSVNAGVPGSGNVSTGSSSALNNYLNTPGQQMLGQGAGQYFQNSPGYQYAMDQAMSQVQGAASARGMLESGAVLRDMSRNAQGLASQEYNNWWNQQNQLYGDYQNRLAGLASGDTGAANAMQLGQNQAANSQQTGSNLGSLFGNQANTGLGAYTNTGAAQSNNMTQAANTQLQTNSANMSTLLAGATLNGNNNNIVRKF